MTDIDVREPAARRLPVVNTHVHVPPNFSAFATVADAVDAAAREGATALGISNFFDQQVYADFAEHAGRAGIVPLYGLEFITLDDDLAAAGIRVNDPANPGRMYLCGKGIAPFKVKSANAARIATQIRQGNDDRASAMVAKLADWFGACGLVTELTADVIAADVALAADVPVEWVSLQERHVAMAFQRALAELPLDPARRRPRTSLRGAGDGRSRRPGRCAGRGAVPADQGRHPRVRARGSAELRRRL